MKKRDYPINRFTRGLIRGLCFCGVGILSRHSEWFWLGVLIVVFLIYEVLPDD